MRSTLRRLVALVGAATTAMGCARVAPQPAHRDAAHPYVVLVSFDAFRHDYIDRFQPSAFVDIAAAGVRAAALVSSFPSKTFPNHYTLVTGLYPGHHGIVGNAFYDPARRSWYRNGDPSAVRDGSWYSGEPIWVTAERNGVKSGAYFWPGSEAAIGGVRPSHVVTYNGKVPNATRVNGAIAWLRLPPADRPHLVLLYFSEVDDTTHHYGPDSPHTAVAVQSVNNVLRLLRDSLAMLPIADSVNIVLVSDHGMAQIAAGHLVPVAELLVRGGVDTTHMEVSDNGPTISLWFNGDTARLTRARAVLDAGLAHAHAYLRADTPPRWHVRDNARAGDLLAVADEGYILQWRASDKAPSAGAHGYDPALPDMQGIFLAAGPNVKPLGVIPAFENVNVYPFLAALLRLDRVPATDGDLRVLAAALRQ